MATKKPTKSSAPTLHTDARLASLVELRARSLADTVAASRVREGWSFSPAMDLLWAAGWPNLHVVDDDPCSDSPEQAKALFTGQWEQGTMPVAKSALEAFLRVLRDGRLDTQSTLDARSEALLSSVAPWSPDELRAFVRAHALPRSARGPLGPLRLSAVEPLLGAKDTVETVLSTLESWSDEDLAAWSVDSCTLVHELGFVLLRLDPASHSDAIARLSALVTRCIDAWPHAPHELDSIRESGWLVATLQLLVGGDSAALQRGVMIDGHLQQFAFDFAESASLVVDACPGFSLGKWAYLHGRALWLGGEPMLRWYRDQWKKFTAHNAHVRIVRVLGEVRSPIVTECMLALASESKAKKAARAWFASHRSYALETLPPLVDGPHATLARAILAELS